MIRQRMIVLAGVSAMALAGCSALAGAPGQPTAQKVSAVQCAYPPAGDPVRPVEPPQSADVPNRGEAAVTLRMTEGDVTITMDRSTAPCAVNSFESLAQQGYYNGISCHRLVEQGIFVLQCGDPSGTGQGGPGYTFPDEIAGNESYTAGTVAMANAGKDTNGSQFFIVWADSTTLGPKYTVLGRVDAASLEVVQSIASQGIDATDPPRPLADATIESVVMG